MKTEVPAFERVLGDALGIVHRHFDIVNGFFNRCRVGMVDERQAGNRLAIVDLT